MLPWADALGYGAAGGLVIEVVVTWGRLHSWQQARYAATEADKPRPPVTKFIELTPGIAVGITRAFLGCAAAALLRAELSGVYAALTVGASAPAVLASLGRVVSVGPQPDAAGQDPRLEPGDEVAT